MTRAASTKPPALRLLCVIAVMSATLSCGTISSRIPRGTDRQVPDAWVPFQDKVRIYSGTIYDCVVFWDAIVDPGPLSVLAPFLLVVDLPLSFVLDTLILPATVYEQVTLRDDEACPEEADAHGGSRPVSHRCSDADSEEDDCRAW